MPEFSRLTFDILLEVDMALSKHKMALIIEEASHSFWASIAKSFPDATSGDLSPGATFAFDTAAETAVEEWVSNNVPHKQFVD